MVQFSCVLCFPSRRVCASAKKTQEEQVEMACPAQSMLSASGCIFLRSKPQAAAASHVRGGIIGGGCSSRPFLLTCNASSPPAPTQEDPDCNEEECAPEKEVQYCSFLHLSWTLRACLVAQHQQ